MNTSLVPDALVDLGMGCESPAKVSALRELTFLCRKGMMSAGSKNHAFLGQPIIKDRETVKQCVGMGPGAGGQKASLIGNT